MMNAEARRTSRSRRLSVALLLWSLVLGASAGASRPQPQDQKMEGYPAVGAPAAVTVLSPGAEPRTKLRYSVPNATKSHMSMNMLMSMSMEMAGMGAMPGMQMPLMKMGADLEVTNVAASGDITYNLAFTGFSVDSTPGVDPAVVAAMQGLDADIKALKGSSTISDRGIARSVNFDFSKVTNPALKQTMDSVSSTLQNMSMPLPEDAVGVGARWEVRQSLAAGGMQTFQKTVFELVGLSDKTATLKTTTEVTAPPQAISNPAMPPGADVRLQKLSGTGTGTMTVHLDGLVPTSEGTMLQNMVMEINMGGTAQTMSTAMTLKMSISPVK
jgi:hypothetical protein